jgi:hypothetical protein
VTPRLKRARLLLAEWAGPEMEPLNIVRLDDGQIFHTPAPHPNIVGWSVECALYECGLGFEAWDLIESVVKPPAGLLNWLRASDRTAAQVQEALSRAIERSKKIGDRR